MCREAGAKKVYIASASPPVKFPNVYGIDMPTRHELVAHDRSIEEIREELGVDKLIYQRLEDLVWAAQEGNPEIKEFDCSCFDGNYVTGNITEDYLANLEGSSRVSKKIKDMPTPGASWNSSTMAG